MTAGFYKKQDGQLLYGSHTVEGNGYVLLAQDKDQYEYPVDGWVWFENEEEAFEQLKTTHLTVGETDTAEPTSTPSRG